MKKQLAAEFVNLLELECADRLRPDCAAIRTRWARWAVPTRSARSISPDSRTARQTRSSSRGLRGFMAVIACWVRSSSSLGSSWGKTGMMVRAVMPCLKALRRTRAFPLSVVGPVLLCALRRLASICLRWPWCKFSSWDRPRREDGGNRTTEIPARPSRNRVTARVNDERRNFGASYNFRVHQALGNLRTPRRF